MSDDATGDESTADLEELDSALAERRDTLEDLESALEAAATEDDLDAVETDLDEAEERLTAIEIPEPPESDEDEEDDEPAPEEALQERFDDLESDCSSLRDELEDQRGPYDEDVIDELTGIRRTITDTRWTEEGEEELETAVEAFLEALAETLDASITLMAADEAMSTLLDETVQQAETAVEDAQLDPDDDAETIAALLEATDALENDVDGATAWSDLEVREQLRREGFYDVLGHVKDFPPEWSALKVHEKRGNVEQILLAYESLDSEFMEAHCLEALERMGPAEAIEPMVAKAGRRDKAAIRILGKIGVEDDEVVETLLDYVDSNPDLQRPAFRALGEIGASDAVQPIANQLVAEEPDVRSWAARALGLIGDTRAIDPLADVLADDEQDRVRASAAWALTQIGTADALGVVAAYDDDPAFLVQAEATKLDLETVA